MIGKEISFWPIPQVRTCISSRGDRMGNLSTIWQFWVPQKGPNDFYETSYQPSLGWGLSFGGVGHPVKTLVWPHEGPQKYRLLNRWTDFNEIFQIFRKKYNKNKNFKKLTLTPFLAPWWRHNPLKSVYFSVFCNFSLVSHRFGPKPCKVFGKILSKLKISKNWP